jgi:hypothetical protein
MTTTDLADGERFLVGSLRRWALGLTDNNGEHWRFVWHDFQNRMGARDGKSALASFAGMVAALQVHARRPLRHHHPCCPCVGADELRIVVLVAACQRRDMELAERLAAWMIEAHGTCRVLRGGWRLPPALVDLHQRRARPGHPFPASLINGRSCRAPTASRRRPSHFT